MSVFDIFAAASGRVVPYLVDKSTGAVSGLDGTHNTVLHSGNSVLAHLMAGDQSYIPSHIGFVSVPVSAGDSSESETLNPISADSSFDELVSGGFLNIAPLLATPKVAESKSVPGVFEAVFTSHTGAGEYVSEAPSSGHVVKRAVLLCRPGSGKHVPFSAVDLESGVEISDEAKYHFGLYWTISFGAASPSADSSDNVTEA